MGSILFICDNIKEVTIADLAEAGHIEAGKVSVEGQIMTGVKGLRGNECLLAHYRMVCCAADLRTITIFLHYPAGYRPKESSWVNVRGVVRRENRGVVLNAEAIESIREPDPPYLY